MLLAGISPGTVLVFLLAGPATNLASIGLLRRELGTRATVAYLVGIAVTSVVLGSAVDALLPGTSARPCVSQFDWWRRACASHHLACGSRSGRAAGCETATLDDRTTRRHQKIIEDVELGRSPYQLADCEVLPI